MSLNHSETDWQLLPPRDTVLGCGAPGWSSGGQAQQCDDGFLHLRLGPAAPGGEQRRGDHLGLRVGSHGSRKASENSVTINLH